MKSNNIRAIIFGGKQYNQYKSYWKFGLNEAIEFFGSLIDRWKNLKWPMRFTKLLKGNTEFIASNINHRLRKY